MKRYVIQYKAHPWEKKWETSAREFDTLEEAREAFDALPFKSEHRIAEAYQVTRYKAVKV